MTKSYLKIKATSRKQMKNNCKRFAGMYMVCVNMIFSEKEQLKILSLYFKLTLLRKSDKK